MSIARDISRQSSKQNATLTADQTAVTVTGGFSGSSIQVYLNGVKIIQGQDYSLNGTSGITLTQGASAGDIIEFVIRNTSNSGFSAANTGQIVDQAVTADKLSDSSTETENVKKRTAAAWVNFNGRLGTSPFTEANGGIRDAFNISTITDAGTGTYIVNFDTAFANDTWSMAGAGRFATYTGDSNSPQINLDRKVNRSSAITTTYARVCATYHYGSSITRADPEEMMLIFFGELS